MKTECPKCRQSIEAGDAMAGMTVSCPRCQSDLLIPAIREGEVIRDTGDYLSLIRDAAVRGELQHVSALLQRDLNVNAPLPNGDHLLSVVACMGDARLEIARLLVSHGADVNVTVGGKTLLSWIQQPTYCHNAATIAFLMSKGARGADLPEGGGPEEPMRGDIEFASPQSNEGISWDNGDSVSQVEYPASEGNITARDAASFIQSHTFIPPAEFRAPPPVIKKKRSISSGTVALVLWGMGLVLSLYVGAWDPLRSTLTDEALVILSAGLNHGSLVLAVIALVKKEGQLAPSFVIALWFARLIWSLMCAAG